jgi:hypothetical protein
VDVSWGGRAQYRNSYPYTKAHRRATQVADSRAAVISRPPQQRDPVFSSHLYVATRILHYIKQYAVGPLFTTSWILGRLKMSCSFLCFLSNSEKFCTALLLTRKVPAQRYWTCMYVCITTPHLRIHLVRLYIIVVYYVHWYLVLKFL